LISFQFLGFPDQSWTNMLDYLWTYVALLLVGANFGFMWGCFFKHESQAISSVILYMTISTLGAGQYINLSTANIVV